MPERIVGTECGSFFFLCICVFSFILKLKSMHLIHSRMNYNIMEINCLFDCLLAWDTARRKPNAIIIIGHYAFSIFACTLTTTTIRTMCAVWAQRYVWKRDIKDCTQLSRPHSDNAISVGLHKHICRLMCVYCMSGCIGSINKQHCSKRCPGRKKIGTQFLAIKYKSPLPACKMNVSTDYRYHWEIVKELLFFLYKLTSLLRLGFFPSLSLRFFPLSLRLFSSRCHSCGALCTLQCAMLSLAKLKHETSVTSPFWRTSKWKSAISLDYTNSAIFFFARKNSYHVSFRLWFAKRRGEKKNHYRIDSLRSHDVCLSAG